VKRLVTATLTLFKPLNETIGFTYDTDTIPNGARRAAMVVARSGGGFVR
jgi:hypothetical protein